MLPSWPWKQAIIIFLSIKKIGWTGLVKLFPGTSQWLIPAHQVLLFPPAELSRWKMKVLPSLAPPAVHSVTLQSIHRWGAEWNIYLPGAILRVPCSHLRCVICLQCFLSPLALSLHPSHAAWLSQLHFSSGSLRARRGRYLSDHHSKGSRRKIQIMGHRGNAGKINKAAITAQGMKNILQGFGSEEAS